MKQATTNPQKRQATMIVRIIVLVCCVGFIACTSATDDLDVGSVEQGGACSRTSNCQAGYTCTNKRCTLIPVVPNMTGQPCTGHQNDPINYCSSDNTLVCRQLSAVPTAEYYCAKAGDILNAPCGFHYECGIGLACSNKSHTCVSTAGDCHVSGTCGLGESCNAGFGSAECESPLICGLSGTCQTIPYYGGPNCDRTTAESGAFRPYFEVPPNNLTTEIEFYRLPYPSDIRIRNSKLDLGGHPAPATESSLVDIKNVYFEVMEEDVTGYAVNAPVFFQFSDQIDLRTVCGPAGSLYPAAEDTSDLSTSYCTSGNSESIYLQDLTQPTNPHIPVEISSSRKKGQYICQNWLGVAPLAGHPLKEGNRYVVVVTNKILGGYNAKPGIRDADFELMLAASAPSNATRPELATAYATMAPFRAWMATLTQAEANAIIGAAMFTTASVTGVAKNIYDAVNAATAPVTFNSDAVDCAVTESPCALTAEDAANPDGLTTTQINAVARFKAARGCVNNAAENYYEVQGTYSAPVFQNGTRPYNNPVNGGAIEYTAAGLPIQNTTHPTEKICYALTVPKTTKPTGGWPIVIFGHGTGGSYRSAIDSGVTSTTDAPTLKDADGIYSTDSIVHTLAAQGFAVLTFDGILHGPRQTEDYGPNPAPAATAKWSSDSGKLFFNVLNARASRDNILQGVADLFYAVRLVKNAAPAVTVGATAITFDPNNIYYMGHSQGTVSAPPFIAYEPSLKGVVLSAAGGELPLSLLNKKTPDASDPTKLVDLKIVVSAAFVDQNLQRVHPMMGHLATLFAATDAVVYAPLLFTNPPITRSAAIPYLQISGGEGNPASADLFDKGDTITPYVTQKAMFDAGAIPIVTTSAARYGAVILAPPTDGVRNIKHNGHFVMFQNRKSATLLQTFFTRVRDNVSPFIVVP
jgi:hypothetical protein